MDLLGTIIGVVGAVVFMFGAALIVGAAFQEHLFWGLAIIFIPAAVFVFIAICWAQSNRGVIFCVIGTLIVAVGAVLRGTA